MPFPNYTHTTVDDFNRANQDPISSPWTSLVGEAVQTAIVSNAMTSGAGSDFYQARYESLNLSPPFEVIALYSNISESVTGGVLDTGSGTLATRTGYSWAINNNAGTMDAALREELGTGSATDIDTNVASAFPTSGDRVGCEVLANGDINVYIEYSPGTWTLVLNANDLTWTNGKLAFGGFSTGTTIDEVTYGVAGGGGGGSPKHMTLLGVG